MKRFYGKGLPLPHVVSKGLMGKLIVLEGADGSGRSTQADLLTAWLERKGYATANVGLNRSTLVSRELSEAKQGNVLTRRTLTLFYATDFADQLENRIIPALKAGFVVLADRYIYTLIARDMVRGGDPAWLESLYGIAIVPDIVFYLQVSPRQLIDRNFQKHATLDYWESGMDLGLSRDMFQSFLKYQELMQAEFRRMQKTYGFDIINGNRSIRAIASDLQVHVESILGRSAA
ncbi:MAG: thymidylate kinase [Candidatus Latescibacteria bacterium]|nr:thymidylate kinase [Candidatus Latescibacterota bacterium]